MAHRARRASLSRDLRHGYVGVDRDEKRAETR